MNLRVNFKFKNKEDVQVIFEVEDDQITGYYEYYNRDPHTLRLLPKHEIDRIENRIKSYLLREHSIGIIA